MEEPENGGYTVDLDRLPVHYSTHRHEAAFWEALGRAVATFGFLEEVLGKAIFAFTATRQIPSEQIEAEYKKWLPTLQRALADPLGGLIDSYGSLAKKHQEAPPGIDELLDHLREAAVWRNAICHGSWRVPDDHGRSLALYIDKKRGIFDTPIGVSELARVQRHTTELACHVMNSVTQMGYRFPGSSGPGKAVW